MSNRLSKYRPDVFIPCPRCGCGTRVHPGRMIFRRNGAHTVGLIQRRCILAKSCGYRGMWTRQADGGRHVRPLYTREEWIASQTKYGPECQFPDCPKPRQSGIAWCQGHEKQKDRHGIAGMKPLNLRISAAIRAAYTQRRKS